MEPGGVQQLWGRDRQLDLTEIDAELAWALHSIPENADGTAERGRATLDCAARRLQKRDWRAIRAVTDDFVVFAVDFELMDLDANLSHSVPAALRKKLASRTLICAARARA